MHRACGSNLWIIGSNTHADAFVKSLGTAYVKWVSHNFSLSIGIALLLPRYIILLVAVSSLRNVSASPVRCFVLQLFQLGLFYGEGLFLLGDSSRLLFDTRLLLSLWEDAATVGSPVRAAIPGGIVTPTFWIICFTVSDASNISFITGCLRHGFLGITKVKQAMCINCLHFSICKRTLSELMLE